MKGLQHTQLAVQHYLLGDGTVSPELAAGIRQQGALDAAGRLAIYHNAYRARLREAMGEAFEKTWTYAGDELFAEAVSAFLDEHQSTFANLRWFGADFPALLQARLPDYPELAELALFEWTLGLAFDAPDAAVADAATYRELDAAGWEQLQLQLHPSVHLLPMWTNAVALWQALGAGDEPPDAVTLDAPVVWMVWRRGLQPHFRSLGALEARALAAAIAGQTFGQMCEHAGAIEADAPQAMGQCLRSWFEQEVLRC